MATTERMTVGAVRLDAVYITGSYRWQREDGGSAELWLLPLDAVCEGLDKRPSEVRAMAASGELEDELGFGGCRYYGGPGRRFSHGAHVSVRRNRVVVSIRHGLDI